ncbi:hypothetical protein [Streptomyces sp. NPDC005549]|uniref:hypothetical protein n=1 Tax=Streptomyces sp. NPDC005549 TaxID=3154888 RepID=UPI0033A9018D
MSVTSLRSGWCAWHKDWARNVRVIQVDEQGSGSGGQRSACPPCIFKHKLTPFAEQETRGTAPTRTGPEATGASMIIMAGMVPTMSDAQREGHACPWCNTPVTVETGIDLGEDHLPRLGVTVHPVACRPCAIREARESFAHHCRMCRRCNQGEYCPEKMPLARFVLEVRS